MPRKSNRGEDGRYHRHPKFKTWRKIQARCEWCGDDFVYYSPLTEDGTPKRPKRFCQHRCVSESRWEGRSIQINKKELLRLYLAGWSGPKLAEHFKVYRHKIYDLLKQLGIARRQHTSIRTCKIPGCGKPSWKRFHHRRDKDGLRILFGTMCREHDLEYHRNWQRAKSRRLDPLRGTRKTGRNPRNCPKCGKAHPTTRKALACCGLHWSQWLKLQGAANPEPRETEETCQ